MNTWPMTMRPRHLTGATLLTLCAVAAQAAAPLIPAEQFAAGAEMTQPRLSPDGTHVVYITTFQGARFVAMYDVKAAKSLPIMPGNSGALTVTHCDFKTDTRLLCHLRGLMH